MCRVCTEVPSRTVHTDAAAPFRKKVKKKRRRKNERIITDPEGIHARPAGLLVKAAAGFKSDIKIEKDGKAANAKTIFGVMGLGVKKDMEIKVTADGEDEAEAVEALQKFFNENL